MGASKDTPAALKEFKDKNNLGFNLLSDPTGELAAAVGVKPGARQTAVIGKDGKIQKIYETAVPAAHPKEVLENLGK